MEDVTYQYKDNWDMDDIDNYGDANYQGSDYMYDPSNVQYSRENSLF